MRLILTAVLLLALAINVPAPLVKPPAKSKRTPPPPWTNGLPKLKQVPYKPTSKPFLSPKARGLFRPGRTSEPPPLPMRIYVRTVNSEFGEYEVTAQATQPANQSLVMEKSADLSVGSWVPLAYYGPVPFEQEAFVAYYTNNKKEFVRANATSIIPSGLEMFPTSSGVIGINPDPKLKVRAWTAPTTLRRK